ncbi:hypothetical protein N7481_013184 [Penicillium waksmanii]|uniref:uncharacterized protein n=1 Tax=Penicillium waksmanii TaxID=69791 RepID=UPI00254903A5|nr:uncharacterized protein N7481_013184 [Penicillium waksmanii]KAJ5966470.1 hypothetical protein N7481_013184 [Penicillium waksmanii]
MPVTRSAACAAEQSENSNIAKLTSKKTKVTKSGTSTTQGTSSNKTTAKRKKSSSDSEYKEGPLERSLLEWVFLKDLPIWAIPNSNEVFFLLQEVQKLKGYTKWDDEIYRKRFLSWELFPELEKALTSRFCSKENIQPTNENYAPIITGEHPINPKRRLYEILIIYFPVDLDEDSIWGIEHSQELPYFYSTDEEWDDKPFPLIGYRGGRSKWMDGECKYHGEPARRLVYFLEFIDEKAEQDYKEKVKWWGTPVIRDVKPNSDVMVNFFHELENLGMIGYDSLHVRFVEVLHYVWEHYVPPPPKSYTMEEKEEQRKWFEHLRELEADPDLDLIGETQY